MNKLFVLVKVSLSSLFSTQKMVNFSSKEERGKSTKKVGLILLCFLALAYSVYTLVDLSMGGYMALNIPYIVLVQYFVICSIFILLSNVFRIKDVLFDFKDYDLLMSLPVKKNTVLISKFITLYVSNLIYALIFMIPALLGYVKYIDVSFGFYPLYLIMMLIIPIVPIIISFIVGIMLTAITSTFKHKNIANYFVNIIFMAVIFWFSFQLNSMESIDMANLGVSMVNLFNRIYPLTNMYLSIISDFNVIAFLEFIFIPIVLFLIFVFIVDRLYIGIRTRLLRSNTKNNYQIKLYKINSPLRSLYKKEIKRYFSSVNYVLNTMIGCILLVISLIGLCIFNTERIEALLEIPNLSNLIVVYGPLVLGICVGMSSTTHSSISLEGKNLWLIKSLPVSTMQIFMSKILVNLTILIPTIIFSSVILTIYLQADIIMFLFLVITPLAYAIFTSVFGLILNLSFPDFDWKNEIKVIKQSLPSFCSIMVAMLIGIIPFIIKHNLDNITYISIITIILYAIDGLLIWYLSVFGKRKFNSL